MITMNLKLTNALDRIIISPGAKLSSRASAIIRIIMNCRFICKRKLGQKPYSLSALQYLFICEKARLIDGIILKVTRLFRFLMGENEVWIFWDLEL